MTARNTDLAETIGNMSTAFETFQSKHDTIMTDVRTKQAELQERLELIEANRSTPVRCGITSEQQDHKNLFLNWLRKPDSAKAKQELENIEHHLQRKTLLIATPSAGGYAVPDLLLREIERFELAFSPVRRLVRVDPIGSSDVRFIVNLRGATSGWAGESTTRNATNTPLLREVTPAGGELYAYPKASNWSLDDMFFNVEQWLAEEVGQAFAVAEGQAVISGNGSSKPLGMLNTAPSARDDFDSPIRAAAVYQYVQDDDSPYALGYDVLVSLVYKLKSQYRANGVWVMNSATAASVMKIKDSQSRPLWVDGLQAGQPNRLLGYPVEIWEDLSDLDANAGGAPGTFPIAFGDFRRGYRLLDRHDVRITRDEVTEVGFTKFYVRKRVYGAPADTNAVKWLRTNA